MTARIQENRLKGLFFIILFIVLMLQTVIGGAQGCGMRNRDLYRGFVASFGMRSADSSSNIRKIDQTGLIHSSGQIGR